MADYLSQEPQRDREGDKRMRGGGRLVKRLILVAGDVGGRPLAATTSLPPLINTYEAAASARLFLMGWVFL